MVAADATCIKQCARLCIAFAGTEIHEDGKTYDATQLKVECFNRAVLQIPKCHHHFPESAPDDLVEAELVKHQTQSWELFKDTKRECLLLLPLYFTQIDTRTNQPRSGMQWPDVFKNMARTLHDDNEEKLYQARVEAAAFKARQAVRTSPRTTPTSSPTKQAGESSSLML